MLKEIIVSLLIIFTLQFCKNETPTIVKKELKLKKIYDLDVKEPSGLTLSFSENELLTVSDNTGKIYKISTQGETLEELNYSGDDLEGITVDIENKNIFIVEEKNRKIIKTDEAGNFIEEYDFPDYSLNSNSGPEGITYNPRTGHFYILNEKSPGMLIDWLPDSGVLAEYNLNFANDYSGIFYEKNEDVLWIVSDASETLSKCDLTGKVIESYKLSFEKAEGIAINYATGEIYIVSDSEEKLYVLTIE